jgi:hypothetical protein
VRELVVWTLAGAPGQATQATAASPEDARAWIAANRLSPEPWQRADGSLERWRARGLELEALTVDRDGERAGALLYRDPGQAGGLPSIVQIAARGEDAAPELLAAFAARREGFRFLNAPANEPASSACERLGARAEIRQHEMVSGSSRNGRAAL